MDIQFDPDKHPRGVHGHFAGSLHETRHGDKITVPGVGGGGQHTIHVSAVGSSKVYGHTQGGKDVGRTTNSYDAASKALIDSGHVLFMGKGTGSRDVKPGDVFRGAGPHGEEFHTVGAGQLQHNEAGNGKISVINPRAMTGFSAEGGKRPPGETTLERSSPKLENSEHFRPAGAGERKGVGTADKPAGKMQRDIEPMSKPQNKTGTPTLKRVENPGKKKTSGIRAGRKGGVQTDPKYQYPLSKLKELRAGIATAIKYNESATYHGHEDAAARGRQELKNIDAQIAYQKSQSKVTKQKVNEKLAGRASQAGTKKKVNKVGEHTIEHSDSSFRAKQRKIEAAEASGPNQVQKDLANLGSGKETHGLTDEGKSLLEHSRGAVGKGGFGASDHKHVVDAVREFEAHGNKSFNVSDHKEKFDSLARFQRVQARKMEAAKRPTLAAGHRARNAALHKLKKAL